MHGVIIRKFNHGEFVHPIVLLVVNIAPKVLFQCLVHLLGLTICLWVKYCGEFALCTKDLKEAFLEVQSELGYLIGDHIIRDTMELDDGVQDKSRRVWSSHNFVAGEEVGYLG